MSLLPEYEVKLGISESWTCTPTHYCPGCEHGILTRLIALTLDQMGLREKAVMVDSVGCSVLAYDYLNCDHIEAPHGRAPAVMAGVKRTHPELLLFTVQGDGDALAIGLLETIYAAVRGEPVTVFLYNNSIYGMTGGQMAPTTLPGQVTTTTPTGRDLETTGTPVDIMKILGPIPKVAYLRRGILAPQPLQTKHGMMYNAKNVLESKKIVENAFKVQLKGGYSFVEFLGTCNVNWKMTVEESKHYLYDQVVNQYTPGVFRDKFGIEGTPK
ncbi:MAG TPA: thiamine pyrophosphate-dependent enzyme [Candidatus Bathyarchaeia archaeon]|nr:thiamine pyrophosphate-dependent enzyme [Candidatus Bathyarchaeia archaeon]